MSQNDVVKIIPSKNHKKFLSEVCTLIKDLNGIGDLRDRKAIDALLIDSIPKICNNFDKSSEEYKAIEILLLDIFENLTTILRFVKASEK